MKVLRLIIGKRTRRMDLRCGNVYSLFTHRVTALSDTWLVIME